jgi:hypothetical protein
MSQTLITSAPAGRVGAVSSRQIIELASRSKARGEMPVAWAAQVKAHLGRWCRRTEHKDQAHPAIRG